LRLLFFWFWGILSLGLAPARARGQTVTRQALYWTRYYLQTSLSPRLTLHLEADNRRFVQPHAHHHLIAHGRLHYRLGRRADVAAGLTYSRQSPQLPGSGGLTVPEWRPVQEANLSQPLGQRLALGHRLRTDERFIRRNGPEGLQPGHDFTLRLRYRLQLTWRLSPKAKKTGWWMAKLADELMVNPIRPEALPFFDQNRIYAGLEYGFSPRLSVEVGYLHWYQQRPSSKDYFARDIVRFTLYHKLLNHA
jgi:hypothetical protein